jgi:flagellar basal body-associated protein FliL
MDNRALYAILILAGAGGAYWFYSRKKATADAQPTDQGPAEAAMSQYTQPPNINAQSAQSGMVYYNNGQSQPLPYNT